MARRKKIIEQDNHERWLVSYADFITLLFAFFVVMYSVSTVNEGKYRVLSETLESVFSETPRSIDPIQLGEVSLGKGEKTPRPGEPEIVKSEIELPPIPEDSSAPVSEETIRTINDISQQLTSTFAEMIENEDVSIKQGDDWLELEIKSKVLFQSGESRLANSAIPAIGKVADILRTSANPIQVEGFTDNNPINTSKFPSNWELSAARAASVVHLLDRFGLNPGRMSAIGYGQFKPIADNNTEQGRQKNRRVVLVVLGEDHSRRSLDIHNNDTSSDNLIGKPSPVQTIVPIKPKQISAPIQQPIGITP